MSKLDSIKIHAIAACCNNYGIGSNGSLPWCLPKESSYYDSIIRGNPPEGKQNAVVMGRATWFSIQKEIRPLEGRINIVMSKTMKYEDFDEPRPHAVVSSLEELIALIISEQWNGRIHDIFNVGGNAIYKEIMWSPYSGYVFLTRIDADIECDTFFPEIDDSFHKIPISNFPSIPQGVVQENGMEWHVDVYEKS